MSCCYCLFEGALLLGVVGLLSNDDAAVVKVIAFELSGVEFLYHKSCAAKSSDTVRINSTGKAYLDLDLF